MMNTADRAAIGALGHFLSWDGDDDLVKTACATHIHWGFQRLVGLGSYANTDLLSRVRVLPLQNQQRLILSPIVHHILGRPFTPEAAGRIEAFIAMEEWLASGESNACGWTALGDYYRPGASEQPALRRGEWCGDQEYRARTAGHLILDTHCSHYETLMPDGVSRITPHSAAEMDSIAAQISEALDRIRDTSLSAATLIRECARLLRLDKAESQPSLSASHSHRHLIGRVGFVNAHSSARWPVAKFINDLVHESVHAMVYKIELAVPLYWDYEAATNLKAVSPWTGHTLNLHSYVHACLVWYGLWAFWERFPEPNERTRRLLERARGGFLEGNPLEKLNDESRNNVYPDVGELIATVAARVS